MITPDEPYAPLTDAEIASIKRNPLSIMQMEWPGPFDKLRNEPTTLRGTSVFIGRAFATIDAERTKRKPMDIGESPEELEDK